MVFQFESLMDFLVMDGHGVYVWSSYIITGIAMKLLILLPFLKRKKLLVQLERQKRLEQVGSREV